MSGGFVKVYGTILTSSVWVESHQTFRVWMTMLLLADRDGYVAGTVPGLANLARVTPDECREALGVLLAPDKDSRTKEHRGRRVKAVDGGWTILNHGKYRELRTESQLANAERQRRFRENQRNGDEEESVTRNVTNAPEDRGQSTESSSSSSAVAELLAVVKNPRAWEGIIAQAQDGMLGSAYKATATQIEAAALDFIAGNHHLNDPSPAFFRKFIARAIRDAALPDPSTPRPSRGGTGQRSADNARKALEDLP